LTGHWTVEQANAEKGGGGMRLGLGLCAPSKSPDGSLEDLTLSSERLGLGPLETRDILSRVNYV
jgi:hypothetical protein